MPRNLYTPSTQPVRRAPDRLLQFIQQAQMEMVYARRQEGRLPLHDSFRLSLSARNAESGGRSDHELRTRRGSPLRPTVYDPDIGTRPAA